MDLPDMYVCMKSVNLNKLQVGIILWFESFYFSVASAGDFAHPKSKITSN